jgi:hypothetical protein
MSVCDLPRFYTWTEPIARKQYHCVECSTPILKGEKHFKYAGKWDVSLETGRQHLLCCQACMFIRDYYDDYDDGDCVPFGGLWEEWSEMEWQYDRKKDRDKPFWKELRSMLAKIKNRERTGKP